MWRRASEVSGVSSFKDTILSDQGPTLMTSFNLHYFLKGPSPNTTTLGIRASI